ncbi:MAG: hypothetical protein ACXVCY_10125 [Pseudobdellovibrionaceae bacterium]
METDSRTGTYFQSEEDYQKELERWALQNPGMPSPLSLVKAYSVYSKEKSKAVAISKKSDKKAHCYVGCRISQVTNYDTANYVGWLKEERDLKDCDPKTHYDEEDYRATLKGAQIGENHSADCLQACTQ